MQYRQFGKLGYEVSLLGLGCMRLPMQQDGEVIKDKAIELIQYAADHGINYFDTAYAYHHMNSESVLGEALDGRRAGVRIATKQPFNVMDTRGSIRKNLEATLKKLRTDYIDVYLVHNIQQSNWEGIKQMGVLAEYEKFRNEGLIGAIAFSYHGGHEVFKQVLDSYDWDMCQVQQNLLDIDIEATQQAITDAGDKGCALVIMEPLKGGGLANATAGVQEVYDSCVPGRSPAEWAFRHLIDSPHVSCILSGMTTLKQLKQNIEIFSAEDALPGCLSDAEKVAIARAKAEYESIISIPCTACGYCMPCPSGVDIPDVFSIYNDAQRLQQWENPRRRYMIKGRTKSDASYCVECGACEQECPQHIDIINKLKVAHEELKGWIE